MSDVFETAHETQLRTDPRPARLASGSQPPPFTHTICAATRVEGVRVWSLGALDGHETLLVIASEASTTSPMEHALEVAADLFAPNR